MNSDTEKLNMMNYVLLDLYKKAGKEDVRMLFLNELRLIVPFDQASFWLYPDKSRSRVSNTVSLDMSQDFIDKYEYFAEKDYVKWFYTYSTSIVYSASKILEDSIRHETEFYKEYLLPEKIAFGCGVILIKDSYLLGSAHLFRTDIYNDFSDDELGVLEFFKPHLESILFSFSSASRINEQPDQCFQQVLSNTAQIFAARFHLSIREKELLDCFLKGLGVDQTSKELGISLSTAKKHMNHIFAKAGISNKNQLFSLLLDCVKESIYS
ncbi:MAG: helix-turn-helix transcriptional regulator [Clostridiales bacterium]|nr:helix-turn-helix transcriptional regulator [Clostridiales bacterium]